VHHRVQEFSVFDAISDNFNPLDVMFRQHGMQHAPHGDFIPSGRYSPPEHAFLLPHQWYFPAANHGLVTTDQRASAAMQYFHDRTAQLAFVNL